MGIARDFGGHLDPQPNTCSDGEPSSKNKGSSEQSSAYGGVYKDCYTLFLNFNEAPIIIFDSWYPDRLSFWLWWKELEMVGVVGK